MNVSIGRFVATNVSVQFGFKGFAYYRVFYDIWMHELRCGLFTLYWEGWPYFDPGDDRLPEYED